MAFNLCVPPRFWGLKYRCLWCTMSAACLSIAFNFTNQVELLPTPFSFLFFPFILPYFNTESPTSFVFILLFLLDKHQTHNVTVTVTVTDLTPIRDASVEKHSQ